MIPSNFKHYLYQAQIKEIIGKIARQISADYLPDTELVLIGILKGSFVFLSDLARNLKIPVEFDFIRASSYRDKTTSGQLYITTDGLMDIEDRNVLIVEDIVDTGRTLNHALGVIKTHRPKTLKVCTLLNKPHQRKIEIPIDYIGHTMKHDFFVIGYGLDHNEKYRDLPHIFYSI